MDSLEKKLRAGSTILGTVLATGGAVAFLEDPSTSEDTVITALEALGIAGVFFGLGLIGAGLIPGTFVSSSNNKR